MISDTIIYCRNYQLKYRTRTCYKIKTLIIQPEIKSKFYTQIISIINKRLPDTCFNISKYFSRIFVDQKIFKSINIKYILTNDNLYKSDNSLCFSEKFYEGKYKHYRDSLDNITFINEF